VINNGFGDDGGEPVSAAEQNVQIVLREFSKSSSQRWENGVGIADQPENRIRPF
jgi:hypothetical protein